MSLPGSDTGFPAGSLGDFRRQIGSPKALVKLNSPSHTPPHAHTHIYIYIESSSSEEERRQLARLGRVFLESYGSLNLTVIVTLLVQLVLWSEFVRSCLGRRFEASEVNRCLFNAKMGQVLGGYCYRDVC